MPNPYICEDLRRAALATVTAERDAALADVDRLTTEVERLRKRLGDDVREKAGIGGPRFRWRRWELP